MKRSNPPLEVNPFNIAKKNRVSLVETHNSDNTTSDADDQAPLTESSELCGIIHHQVDKVSASFGETSVNEDNIELNISDEVVPQSDLNNNASSIVNQVVSQLSTRLSLQELTKSELISEIAKLLKV